MNEEDQPLEILQALEDETSPDFVRRVINRVDRKQTSAHMVVFGWEVGKSVLGEMFGITVELPHLLRGWKREENGERK